MKDMRQEFSALKDTEARKYLNKMLDTWETELVKWCQDRDKFRDNLIE